MSRMTRGLRHWTPRAKPTPRTAPTRAWVVEMGKPGRLATTIVVAAPMLAAKPREGVSWVIFVPMVAIAL